MSIDKWLMTLVLALAGLVALTGCGTNTYGVAQKSAKELKHVSDDDLCYSQRYWRSPQMMNEIRRRGLDCAGVVAAAGEALRIGVIRNTSIAGDCHCSVNPVSQRGKSVHNQYIFASNYEGRARMNINDRDVDLREIGRKESPGILALCSRENCTYSGDGIMAIVDYRAPKKTGYEVTDYDVTITVEKSGQQQSVTGKGQCGC